MLSISSPLISWSSPRSISTSQLNTLLHLHLWPIYLVVFKGPYLLIAMGNLVLRAASRLDAFSVYPFQTWLPSCAVGLQLVHQWFVHPGPLVLRTAPLKFPTPTTDRDRTVSRQMCIRDRNHDFHFICILIFSQIQIFERPLRRFICSIFHISLKFFGLPPKKLMISMAQ